MRFLTMWYVRPAQTSLLIAQSDQSLCKSLEDSLTVKLLTEHHLEFLSLKGGCTGSSESTLVKMPHCWKSHVTAQIVFLPLKIDFVKASSADPDEMPHIFTWIFHRAS